MGKSILRDKSYVFAVEIVKIVRFLQNEQREYVLSKQILRSGTAVGALISEAEFGQSKADFASKLSIALKEANESVYWLNLLHDTNYLSNEEFLRLESNCTELIKMLIASIKTSKSAK